ncbi:MAG: phage tail protein [Desulfobacteraceae bacterium]|jgi:hypothetical protein
MKLFTSGKFVGAKTDFEIHLNRGSYLEAQRMLKGVRDGAERVLMRTINRTLTGLRTDIVRELRKDVNITATAIRDTITIDKARISKLSGRVTSKQLYGTSLAKFNARQTTKGVTVNVLRRKGRSLIKHAFLLKAPHGNTVFWRTKKEFVGTSKRKWSRYKWISTGRSGGESQVIPYYGALPDRYRFPIEKLWGPAVPDLIKHRATYDALDRMAGKRVDKYFTHELNFLLGRL